MYDFDIGGFLTFTMVLVIALALGLVAVLVMWLTGVRPDWWMLWIVVGAVAMAIVSGVIRRLAK